MRFKSMGHQTNREALALSVAVAVARRAWIPAQNSETPSSSTPLSSSSHETYHPRYLR